MKAIHIVGGVWVLHAIKFEDGKSYRLYGNNYHLILPRVITERLESELVKLNEGCKTPRHKHDDMEQFYIILKGRGRVDIDDESKEVVAGMAVYIPRNAFHRITAFEDLSYIYITCWPEGVVPPPRTEEELRQHESRLMAGDPMT